MALAMQQSFRARFGRPRAPAAAQPPGARGAAAAVSNAARVALAARPRLLVRPPAAASGGGSVGACERGGWRTTEGAPLTAEEAASLRHALALLGAPSDEAGGGGGSDDGAALPAAAAQGIGGLLREGVAKGAADLPALEGAMLLAEQAHLGALRFEGAGGEGRPPLGAESRARDVGMWQPVFASAGGFPRLLYIPVLELFDLTNAGGGRPLRNPGSRLSLTGTVDVITELGPFTTHFLGPCCWADARTLEYWVESLRVEGPWGIRLTVPFRLHNALTFFHFNPEEGLACARSRLGGTMLLAADPEAAAKYKAHANTQA